jgi:hypothetical protein
MMIEIGFVMIGIVRNILIKRLKKALFCKNWNHSERNNLARKNSERLPAPTGITLKGKNQKKKTQGRAKCLSEMYFLSLSSLSDSFHSDFGRSKKHFMM